MPRQRDLQKPSTRPKWYGECSPVPRKASVKIALFGPYGFGNMGDAALVEAAMQGLRRHLPEVEFRGICRHPPNVEARHGIPAWPIFRNYPVAAREGPPSSNGSLGGRRPVPPRGFAARLRRWIKSVPVLHSYVLFPLAEIVRETRFMVRSYRLLRTLDAVVMPGSGQLHEEWGGPFSYPLALCKWAILARAAGCRLVFLSVGSGTLRSRPGRLFGRIALSLAHYSSFRDVKTQALAATLGVVNGAVVPDLAFGLSWDRRRRTIPDQAPRGNGIVGINPIAYCDPRGWHRKDERVYRNYVEKMAAMGQWLLAEGYRLLFISNELRTDRLVIEDIVKLLQFQGVASTNVLQPATANLQDVLAHIGSCDFVLACRFHGVLFSFLQAKPVITIAFHYKLALLAEEMGQGRYCVDIERFSVEALQGLFQCLSNERLEAIKRTEAALRDYPAMLERQYRTAAQVISRSSRGPRSGRPRQTTPGAS